MNSLCVFCALSHLWFWVARYSGDQTGKVGQTKLPKESEWSSPQNILFAWSLRCSYRNCVGKKTDTPFSKCVTIPIDSLSENMRQGYLDSLISAFHRSLLSGDSTVELCVVCRDDLHRLHRRNVVSSQRLSIWRCCKRQPGLPASQVRPHGVSSLDVFTALVGCSRKFQSSIAN